MSKIIFCSNCGTELNANAKFCFSCGAKIDFFDANNVNNIENNVTHKLYTQYYDIICNKIIESYINDIKPPVNILYKNGTNYGFTEEMVDKTIMELKTKIETFIKHLEGLYVNGGLLMLDITEDISEECIQFAVNIGLTDSDAYDLYEYFTEKNRIVDKVYVLNGQLLSYESKGTVCDYEEIPVNKEINNDAYYIRFKKALLEMEDLQLSLHQKSNSIELSEKDRKQLYEKGLELGFRDFKNIESCIIGAEVKLGYAQEVQQREYEIMRKNNEIMFSDILPTRKMEFWGKELVFNSNYFFEDYTRDSLESVLEKDKLKLVATLKSAVAEKENLKKFENYFQVNEWGNIIRGIFEKNYSDFIGKLPVAKDDRNSLYDKTIKKFDKVLEKFDDNMCEIASIIEAIDNGVNVTELQGEINKAFRGRWSGGGFGLKGAIKCAVTSSVLNVGTGLVYDAINSISTSNAQRKAVKQKQEILTHAIARVDDFIDFLIEHVADAFLKVIYAKYPFCYIKYDESEEKNIYEKYLAERDMQKKKDFAIDLLRIAPKNEAYYVMIAKKICNSEESEKQKDLDSLFKIATWFKVSVSNIKKHVIKQIMESYSADNIECCEKIFEVENLFNYNYATEERKKIFGVFLETSKTTTLDNYSFEELCSIEDNIEKFGQKFKFSHSIKSFKIDRIEKYICYHIENDLKEYTNDEVEMLINTIESVGKTFDYIVDKHIEQIFRSYVDYHIKNDLKEHTSEEISVLAENINWINKKYSYPVENTKIEIFNLIFEKFNINLNSEDKESIERNIEQLVNINENCTWDFSSFIAQQKDVLSQLVKDEDIRLRTVDDVLYDTIDEAEIGRKEMETIKQIYDSYSVTDTDKYCKLLNCKFTTEQAKAKVKKCEKSLINHIEYCKDNTIRRTSLGWFVLFLLLTPVVAGVGFIFGIIGIIIALIIVLVMWGNYCEIYGDVRIHNANIPKYKAEITEFKKLFKVEGDRIKVLDVSESQNIVNSKPIAQIICECGYENEGEAKFCVKCGNKLNS